MALITPDDVLMYAPEFAPLHAAEPTIIAKFIVETEGTVSPSAFGGSARRALSLYTAHLLSVFRPVSGADGGGGRTVASETIGPTSITYAAESSPATVDNLDTSKYGREFRVLCRGARGARVT